MVHGVKCNNFLMWEKGELELTKELRDEIILEFLPMVRSIALRIVHRLPSQVQVDDLINAGILGLMDAIGKFNPEHNASFKTYANSRVHGSIIDELRKMDWAPRSVRKNTRTLEQAVFELEKQNSRNPTDEELAKYMNISVSEVSQMLYDASSTTLFSLDEVKRTSDDTMGGQTLLDVIPANDTPDPLHIFSIREVKHIVKETIETLPEKEKLVLSLYYFDELTMKEVGEVLDITESRVCQVHGRAIVKLKSKLAKCKG